MGKNMFELVDANPTVGIGGSGNIVGGVAKFGIAIDAEIDARPIDIDIVETCGGAYIC